MPLAAGARLGPYEILHLVGEGGMGEVWRATDTRLNRDVAIKVLPPAFTDDKERLGRFEREARLLAQLHHPNIASIFGLEEGDGARALVMELVAGPTLAERLAAGAIPLVESLSIARQIALANRPHRARGAPAAAGGCRHRLGADARPPGAAKRPIDSHSRSLPAEAAPRRCSGRP